MYVYVQLDHARMKRKAKSRLRESAPQKIFLFVFTPKTPFAHFCCALGKPEEIVIVQAKNFCFLFLRLSWSRELKNFGDTSGQACALILTFTLTANW